MSAEQVQKQMPGGLIRRARSLPIAWKMAAAPLVMVLVFSVPTFAIVRDLTSRAAIQLNDSLARRGDQVRASILQDEFYLLDSVRFGANLQGLPEAIKRRDSKAIQGIFDSVIALKDRLDLLVVTDARGIALAQIAGVKDHRVRTSGSTWAGVSPVRAALASTGTPSAGLIPWKSNPALAVVSPVRVGGRSVGSVLAALALPTIATDAAPSDGAVTLYDLKGTPAAYAGGLAYRHTLTGLPSAGTTRTSKIEGKDASTLLLPLNVGRSRIGSIAVTLPRAPAFALAERVTRNLEMLLIVAIAAGLALLFLLTRFLLTQITQLSRANQALAARDFSARVDVLSRDELGRAAEGVNLMAEELEESYRELETRVAERTLELKVARDVAQEATETKAQFLANMSHEIRTPMNAVIGMTSLLLDTKLDPRQRDYADTIRASGDHLLTIINDILDFSKIEAGKLDLELHGFAVRSCVEEALDLVALRASESHIELAYVVDAGTPPAVLGDLGRTRQVLLNLLSNAVKFTEQGEVVVTVTSTPANGSKHELHFAVRDTGIGIQKGRADRLFTAFSQVDPSTTRLYGGTGLGLAISKLLVELMGGTIWVESDPGKGSTFHFTIVAEEAEAPEEHLIIAGADLRGKQVLIVDDNATNRHIATEYVRRWGMIPTEAATPARARKLVEHGKHFDVALLDHDMPKMTGSELAGILLRRRPKLPLILLSSLGSAEHRAARLFAAALTKPIKPSQLHDAIMQVLVGAPAKLEAAAMKVLDSGMAARHPLRILVAEDNPVNQKVSVAVLGKLGYKPDVASDGTEAVAAVERQTYDVVFMDVQMPVMDGLDATRMICKRFPEAARPRIIAMTANATAEDRKLCLDAGMNDYLAKPVTPAKIVEALGRSGQVEPANGETKQQTQGRRKART